MAWENSGPTFTLPASTGLSQFTAVTVNGSGLLAKPAVGTAIIGVLVSSGTNASTSDTQVGTVQWGGVAKLVMAGSTVSVGDQISASSAGRGRALGSGHNAIGIVVDGSSGSTGRICSVLLSPIGTT